MALKLIKEKIKTTLRRDYPSLFLRIIYYRVTGKFLYLNNPNTFNEKIQWLKFYHYPVNKLVIKCTDKYLITEYLKEKELEDINAKLIGCWDNFNEIDFESLPKKFLLKTNNASGTNFFCKDKDKLNIADLRLKFNYWLKTDFGGFTLERHYSKITPKIIAEEYLEFSDENIEYNFYCFNGVVRFCKVVSFDDKELKSGKGRCYDINWLELPFDFEDKKLVEIDRPDQYDYMLKVCEHIAKDFIFVRVDFFQCIDKVVLGELTFSPASGFATTFNKFAQQEMGNWLNLNRDKAKL